MAKPPTRDLVKIIFTNFINSFKKRQTKGNFMGEDYFGNKYYEIPPNPYIGKRKASRWFEPSEKEEFEQERTAEWDSWLRGRRDTPPTKEELINNLAIMNMKKKNAAKLDIKYGKKPDALALPQERKGKLSFPSYEEYENIPGEGRVRDK